jgi:shikimate dehydrogenase
MVELNGASRLYIIIGDPIVQVKAPAHLTPVIQAQGENAVIIPVRVSPEDFDGFMENVKKAENADGIIVTIPHKFAA